MLIKQFLNDDQHTELLNWAKTLNYYFPCNGQNVLVYYLTNPYLPLLDKIIEKVNTFYDKSYKIDYEESCIVRIQSLGWINMHDDLYKHKDVVNFNILLNKSEQDGHIIHGDKKILWQEKDAYILDATVKHGVTSVKTETPFYSILLYYFK